MSYQQNSENLYSITGNVGADPEFVEFENGGGVLNLSVATTEKLSSYDEDKGEYVDEGERVTWHSVRLYGKRAASLKDIISKGMRLTARGMFRKDVWEDEDSGETRSVAYLRAENLVLPPKGASQQANANEGSPGDSNVPF